MSSADESKPTALEGQESGPENAGRAVSMEAASAEAGEAAAEPAAAEKAADRAPEEKGAVNAGRDDGETELAPAGARQAQADKNTDIADVSQTASEDGDGSLPEDGGAPVTNVAAPSAAGADATEPLSDEPPAMSTAADETKAMDLDFTPLYERNGEAGDAAFEPHGTTAQIADANQPADSEAAGEGRVAADFKSGVSGKRAAGTVAVALAVALVASGVTYAATSSLSGEAPDAEPPAVSTDTADGEEAQQASSESAGEEDSEEEEQEEGGEEEASGTGEEADSEEEDDVDAAARDSHEHTWTAVYSKVKHAATYTTTHYPTTYKQVTEYHTVCNVCGEEIDDAVAEHKSETGHYSWTKDVAVVKTVVDEEAHDEKTLVKEAWTEKIQTGWVCEECGEEKDL